MVFDAIIIGSGPAGCAAAITCRQAGFRTLIVTMVKDSVAPEKEPSESIHPGVETLLARLKASHCVAKASVGVYEGILVGENCTPLGSDEAGAWLGNHINRNAFDAAILECAASQGAEILYDDVVGLILENERVVGVKTGSGQLLSSHYVIDASGYKSVGGTNLKLEKEFLSPPLVTYTGVSKGLFHDNLGFRDRFTVFIPQSNGWTWLAPEHANYCTWTKLTTKGKQQYLPPGELKQFVPAGKVKVANRRWRIFRPTCKEGIILCGDAAGIIDPAAGQGILNALMSGIASAQIFTSITKKPGFEPFYLAGYDKWFYTLFSDKVQKLKVYYQEHGISIF